MQVRLARPADSEAILAIYNEAVLRSTATFDLVPRTEEEQAQWMDEHRGPHPAIVATTDAVTVGFGALSPYRDKHAYATTVENSVYVRRRPSGGGHRPGPARGAHPAGRQARVPLHHRPHRREQHGLDRPAQACGFELVGVEREVGRKFNRWLDVSVLQRLL